MKVKHVEYSHVSESHHIFHKRNTEKSNLLGSIKYIVANAKQWLWERIKKANLKPFIKVPKNKQKQLLQTTCKKNYKHSYSDL